MRFRATLLLHGKTATGFEVPPAVVEQLGGGRQPPVTVTVGPHTWRTTIARRGDVFLLGVSAEHRDAAGLRAGDEVDVDLALDTAPREVEVPDDLAAALLAAGVRPAFDALAFTSRKEHARAVAEAKRPETRERRVAKVVASLRAAG